MATLDKLAAALGTSRTELMRAGGYIETDNGPTPDADEVRLLALFRSLSQPGRTTLVQFARFVHADEHRWVQPMLELTARHTDEVQEHNGPSLFDTIPPVPDPVLPD